MFLNNLRFHFKKVLQLLLAQQTVITETVIPRLLISTVLPVHDANFNVGRGA
jgi:hypothetical protein